MEKSSIRHFLNGDYVYKTFKGTYLFRLACKKNDLSKVTFVYLDKYRFGIRGYDHKDYLVMNKVASTDIYDYYETEINCSFPAIKYYFILEGNEILYFSNGVFYTNEPKDIIYMFTANTYILDDSYFSVPAWSRGAVFYQIFPERFNPTSNYSKNWFDVDVKHFYRTNGTLDGIAKKIDYLCDLGIDCIYLNPIFKANSSHRYDTVDYFEVCEKLGGHDGFMNLVNKAHSKGIKVILDIAFNHTSTDFFAFKDLCINQEQSKYKDWYFIYKFPFKKDFFEYKCFSYYYMMPKLNTTNKEVEEYLLDVTRYYLEEFKIDGFRLDVCDEVSHNFWKKFRSTVKSINKDALILGEIWYESTPWLRGDEIDTITNYTSLNAIKNLCKRKLSIDEFINIYEKDRGEGNINYLPSTLNMISNHDTIRCFRDLDKDKDRFKVALALDLLLPGASLIYYGDEQMMDGGMDPDCRRGMLFNNCDEMYQYTKKLINIKKNDAFKNIDFTFEKISDDVFTLTRYGNDSFIVYVNLADSEYNLPFSQWDLITDKEILFLTKMSVSVFKK